MGYIDPCHTPAPISNCLAIRSKSRARGPNGVPGERTEFIEKNLCVLWGLRGEPTEVATL